MRCKRSSVSAHDSTKQVSSPRILSLVLVLSMSRCIFSTAVKFSRQVFGFFAVCCCLLKVVNEGALCFIVFLLEVFPTI